jgi:TolB-like protein/Tfp pilus assembly protein PilF
MGFNANKLIGELRRRRVFRTAGYYIVGAWLLLQVADVVFPGFGLPDAAIQALVWAAFLGFPLALVFGWLFDITPEGIRRTPPLATGEAPDAIPLGGRDWIILAAMALMLGVIAVRATQEILEMPGEDAGAAAPTAESTTDAAAAPLENSIAVLPFDNLSNDPDNSYFCDGVAEEILNSLGRYIGLNVIGRTSSFAFRYDRPPAARISQVLGARFLLQGSVRKAGEQLRISAQLLDAQGVQLWSDQFDRTLGDVFALQSEIADTVAHTVVPQIAPGTVTSREPDPAAFDLYLQGRDALHRRNRHRAEELLQRAVDIDPDFAAAQAELAIALAMGAAPDDRMSRARAAIDRAQALQPDNARSMAAEGLYFSQVHPPNLEASERALRKALAMEPNMVDALNWMNGVLLENGQPDAAFATLERAARLDPLHPAITANLALTLAQRGQFERAEQKLLALRDLPEPRMMVFNQLREFYVQRGRLADAYSVFLPRLQQREPVNYYWGFAENEILLGRWDRADYWLQYNAQAKLEGLTNRAFDNWIDFLSTTSPYYRGDYARADAALQRVLTEQGLALRDLPFMMVRWLGVLPGLAGRCDESIDLLEPALYPERPDKLPAYDFNDESSRDALHLLAWCQQQTGNEARAKEILQHGENLVAERIEQGEQPLSGVQFFHARNAAMLNDIDLAVARLEGAIAAGWRSLNLHAREPFWAKLRADTRAAALLQKVRDDISRQRAQVEAMDAEWDPVEWHRQSVRQDAR